MILTTNQKAHLAEMYRRAEDMGQVMTIPEMIDFWVRQIEQLEEKTLEQRQYETLKEKECNCNYCNCEDNEIKAGGKCQNKPEEKECKHEHINGLTDRCMYCDKYFEDKPQRIEELEEKIYNCRGWEHTELTPINNKVNELIRAYNNKLNNL